MRALQGVCTVSGCQRLQHSSLPHVLRPKAQYCHGQDLWRWTRIVSLCACGAKINPIFSFCPYCGVDLRCSTKARRAEVPSVDRSLCRTLRACATRTFERLAHHHFDRSVPGEETFTDLNLQDLSRLHGDRVAIHKFTRQQESRNGADWEWWFYSGNVGFGVRVQAKRAMRGGGYKLEHTVSGTGRSQSRLLVQDALAAGCIPAYVLYNHRNWVPRSRTGRVVDCRHGQGEETQLGCTIVSALTVHVALRERPTRAAFVRDQSIPWHRILCDDSIVGGSWLDKAHAETQNLHLRGLNDWVAQASVLPHQGARYKVQYETRARDGEGRRLRVPGRDYSRSVIQPQEMAGLQPEGPEGWDPFEESERTCSADLEAAEQGLLAKLRISDPETMTLPHYRGLTDVSTRRVRRLPDRILDMIRTTRDVAEAPDERAAGAVLVNLSDLT